MEPTKSVTATNITEPITPVAASSAPVVVEELLIEEISIDGMCGVY